MFAYTIVHLTCCARQIAVCARLYSNVKYFRVEGKLKVYFAHHQSKTLSGYRGSFYIYIYKTCYNKTRVLCSWFHTPVFGVRNSIINWVSKTQSLKRKKRRYLKLRKAFFKLVISFLKNILFLIASKSIKTFLLYLCEFVMSYEACNVLINRRQTLWLTILDMMNVAILDCYEYMNSI